MSILENPASNSFFSYDFLTGSLYKSEKTSIISDAAPIFSLIDKENCSEICFSAYDTSIRSIKKSAHSHTSS